MPIFNGPMQIVFRHGAGMGRGSTRTFYDLSETYSTVVAVGLGSKDQLYDQIEERDEMRESIRIAMAGEGAKSADPAKE